MPSVKKTFFAIVAIVLSYCASAQYVQPGRFDDYSFTKKMNVGSGTVRVTAPSAYFEVGPTLGGNAGFLVPRLSTAERNAIVSPADGLMIYNVTSKKFNYFDGSSSSWKEIGSGTGGGITQLGSSPWGLSILDDSTYVVDSMKVLTKYQGEKTRDSLAALINLRMLKSDSLSVGNPTGYVTGKILKDSAAGKVDTTKAVKIDTAGKATGKVPKWDAACNCFKMADDSVGTGGGGSSGSGAFAKLEWFTGDENAPAIGDSTMVNDSFSAKYLDVYRNGIKQPHVVGDTGWARVNDTTIKVIPYFAASEFWHIEARDSASYTQLTLQAPSSPPATTIAYVNSADGGNNGGSSNSRTFSYTVGSASNTILLVGFVGDVQSGADDVSSVTYNGVSMTLVNKTYNSTAGGRWQYLYYLLSPATGAHNVVITCSSTHYIIAGAAEYSGVQSIESSTTNNTDLSTLTTTTTTVANNCWNVIFSGSPGAVSNASTGSTKRANSSIEYWTWFDSGGAITPAGSYSMTTTVSAGSKIGHCLAVLKPY